MSHNDEDQTRDPNIENLNPSQLVADEAYEFLLVWSSFKMKGTTGSPGKPAALD